MIEKTVRELLLEQALLEIIKDAPEQEPIPLSKWPNDYQIEDYGYIRARWHDAEIARKALDIKSG